jgi:hypothetical protein
MLTIDGQYIKIAGNKALIGQHCRELARIISAGLMQVEKPARNSSSH